MSWTEHTLPGGSNSPRAMYGFSDSEIYVVTGSEIIRWNGTSWATLLGSISNASVIWGATNAAIWVVGGTSIRRSTDGGTTWPTQPLPQSGAGNFTAIWGSSANTIFLAGSAPGASSRVWRSTDGGSSWSTLFDDPSGDAYVTIFGFSSTEVYFAGFSGTVKRWDGGTANTVQADTFSEENNGLWGPGTGSIYWVSDIPSSPHGQIMHYFSGSTFTESGPYPTNGGANPSIQLSAIFGKNAHSIFACGTGTTSLLGAHVYSLQTLNNAGPGTWTEETLPASATGGGAGLFAIWGNPATGLVVAAGSNSTSASTAYFRAPSAAPTITSFNPTSGFPGDTINVVGTGFSVSVEVDVNGLNAGAYTIVDDSHLHFTIPANATTGPIKVINPDTSGQSSTNLTIVPPTISSISPPSAATGSQVIITGTHLANATSVGFGSSGGYAAVFTVNSPTQITAFVPAAVSGSASITVIVSDSPSSATHSFSVTEPIEVFVDIRNTGDPNIEPIFGWAVDDNKISTVTRNGNTGQYQIDHTSNGGGSWSQVHSFSPSITFLDMQGFGNTLLVACVRGFHATSDPLISRSTDAGATWSDVNTIPITGASTDQINCVCGKSATDWLCADANGNVYESTDSGATWSFLSQPQGTLGAGYGVVSLFAQSTTSIWATNGFKRLLHSTDGGSTWTLVFTDPNADYIGSIYANGSKVATAIFDGSGRPGGVWTSSNGGTSFVNNAANLGLRGTVSSPSMPMVKMTAQSSTAFWAAGTTQTPSFSITPLLIASTDGGTTWHDAFSGNPNVPAEVQSNFNTPFSTSNFAYIPGPGFLLKASLPGPPVISALTPSASTVLTQISITGSGLTGTTAVSFNGTPASTFQFVNDSLVTAVVPIGATTGTVTLTVNSNPVNSPSPFTVEPGPGISSVSPTTAWGGDTVLLTGTGFSTVTTAHVNGLNAPTFTILNNTSMTVLVPASATTGRITVTNPAGTADPGPILTIVPDDPAITSFSPTATVVGNTVTITGSQFTNSTAVAFNGVPATSFHIVDDGHITAVVPSGGATGHISITGPGGTGTSSGTFTLMAGPISVTDCAIHFGHSPAAGGTVRIEGANFAPGCQVFIGNVAASVTSTATGLIICTSGPHVPAVVNVKVVNPDSSSSLVIDAFSYDDSTIPVLDPKILQTYPFLRVHYLMSAVNSAVPGPLIYWTSTLAPDFVGVLSGQPITNLSDIEIVEAFWSA